MSHSPIQSHHGSPYLHHDQFPRPQTPVDHPEHLSSTQSGFSHPASSTWIGPVDGLQPHPYHQAPTQTFQGVVNYGNGLSIPNSLPPPPWSPQTSLPPWENLHGEIQLQPPVTSRALVASLAEMINARPEDERPQVTEASLRRSIELHQSLADEDIMMYLTPGYFLTQGVEMVMIEVDDASGDGSKIKVPFFPNLLPRTPRSPCPICDEDREYSPPLANWRRATRGFGEMWIADFLKFPTCEEPAQCHSHRRDICCSCWREYIEYQMKTRGRTAANNIQCPMPGCHTTLASDAIRALVPADTFRRYDEQCTLKRLSADPDFQWCLRAGCSSGVFLGNPHAELMPALHQPVAPCPQLCITCPDCELAMCTQCQVPWHDGLTCHEYQARHRLESEATEEFLDEFVAVCPGEGCKARVLVEGRKRVACENCHTDFCCGCGGTRGAHTAACGFAVRKRKARQAPFCERVSRRKL